MDSNVKDKLVVFVETPAGFDHYIVIDLCELPEMPHDDQIRAHLREIADTTDWAILGAGLLDMTSPDGSLEGVVPLDNMMIDFYTDGRG